MTNEVGSAIALVYGLIFSTAFILRRILLKKNPVRFKIINYVLEWINVLIPTAFLFTLGMDWKFDHDILPSQNPRDLTFSSFHIAMIGLVVFAIVIILREHGKGKQNEQTYFKGRMNVVDYKILKFGVLLVGIEIFKQIVYLNLFSPTLPYSWSGFPLQFCSLPIFFFPIIPFLKPGKVKNTLYHYVAIFTLIGGLSVMLTGGGVFNLAVSISLHTMIWHGTMVVAAIYVGVATKVGNNIMNFINALYVFLATLLFIQIVNMIFHFIGLKYPPIAEFDGFYISPWATSTGIPFIGGLRLKLQEFKFPFFLSALVITLFYSTFVSLGGYLIFLLYQTTFKYREQERKKVVLEVEAATASALEEAEVKATEMPEARKEIDQVTIEVPSDVVD